MRSLLCLMLVAACGSPSIGDGTVRCGAGDACPPGFECGADGFCWRNPTAVDAGDPDARPSICGNSTLEAGETCDPPASCPTVCEDDSNDCTADVLSGAASTCDVVCNHTPIETCADGDLCCPTGCNSTTDAECSVSCGNGTIEAGETCDPPGSCPTTCNDGNACTNDTLLGSAANCNVSCSYSGIVACVHTDGCCPTGCNSAIDNDCSASCGNGLLETGETCDPPASCPSSCSDGNSCTVDSSTGSAANCNLSCGHSTITSCTDGDGCCPGGCTSISDDDCSASCGNGIVEAGETCDPPGSCPPNCNDGNACTIDTMTGTAANCNVACSHSSISTCISGDGCCPAGCTAATDNNCSSSCGNGVIEAGETCDPPISCPMFCSDGNSCTIDSMTGNPANCNVVCSFPPITSCAHNDGCCPAGCTGSVDNNCPCTGGGDGGVVMPPGDGGLCTG